LLAGGGETQEEKEEAVKVADELAKEDAEKLAAAAAEDGSRCAHRRQ
jgi:hypothetical protein